MIYSIILPYWCISKVFKLNNYKSEFCFSYCTGINIIVRQSMAQMIIRKNNVLSGIFWAPRSVFKRMQFAWPFIGAQNLVFPYYHLRQAFSHYNSVHVLHVSEKAAHCPFFFLEVTNMPCPFLKPKISPVPF